MKRLYGDRAYDTAENPGSYWRASAPGYPRPPLTGNHHAEVAVIGAGYTGLNAALALARCGISVAVLEAGEIGWGASGRNGGFCCLGGAKLSGSTMRGRYGDVEAGRFQAFQSEAIRYVADLLDQAGMEADRGPVGEVELAHSPRVWRNMQREGGQLRSVEELTADGIYANGVYGGRLTPEGFPLHPMKYVLGLAEVSEAAGARIFADSNVLSLTGDSGSWTARTASGTVRARKVLIATNGYSSEDLPDWLAGRILPVFSSILVTRPLKDAELTAQGWTNPMMAYDSRQLLHYFRLLPDGRFLFGMRGGLSAGRPEEAAIQALARKHFTSMFPAWANVRIDYEWSGLVCLTSSLTPFAGPVPGADGLFAAFGWHGNGVAMASFTGHEVGRMMAGENLRLPAPIAAPPRRVPFPSLRIPALRLAYRWMAWRDGPMPRPK